MAELTPKQAAFVREYLVDLNGTRAAIRAGYSAKTAESQAARLLGKAKVKAEIALGVQARNERVEVKADDVLRELVRLATCDLGQAFDAEGRLRKIHEMPVDVRRAIASVDTAEMWGPDGGAQLGEVKRIKFWDKAKALEMLGKHLRLFVDRQEHSGPDGQKLEIVVHKYGPEEGKG